MKTSKYRPVLMDGEVEFVSVYEAARFLCDRTGLEPTQTRIRTMVANICNVVGVVGRRGAPKTAYGHVWADAKPSLRTAAYDYELRIVELEALIRDMLPYMMDSIGSDGIRKRVRELGLEK